MTAVAPRPIPATTVGFSNVVLAEWTKLRSLRSSYLCLALTALCMLGLAVTMGVRWAYQSEPVPDGFDATNVALSGTYLAEVIVATVAVMSLGSEYATGMIRLTFTAVPQRRIVLLAKAIVLTVSTVLAGELLSLASFLTAQAFFARKHAGVGLADPGAARSVVGAGLFLGAIALLAFGLAGIIRHTAGALSAFFGVLFALNPLVDLLPTWLRNDVINYLPLNAGNQVFVTQPGTGALGPWTGLGVLAGYAAVSLATALLLVNHRDA
jgi:ABC-2 type transport system permease protein